MSHMGNGVQLSGRDLPSKLKALGSIPSTTKKQGPERNNVK
jgi:hypothetical protein